MPVAANAGRRDQLQIEGNVVSASPVQHEEKMHVKGIGVCTILFGNCLYQIVTEGIASSKEAPYDDNGVCSNWMLVGHQTPENGKVNAWVG